MFICFISNVIVINVSGQGVDLVNEGGVLGTMGEIVSGELDEVLLLDLKNIVVVNISGERVDLINQ